MDSRSKRQISPLRDQVMILAQPSVEMTVQGVLSPS